MSYPLYIKALISYIEVHITEKRLDYARLEREIGFSQAHMRELFRRDTGYPLVQYVQMRKIKRSALDLLSSDKSILEIAYQYGFEHPETYTRSFVRVTGMTPSDFRKKRPLVGKEELAPGIYSIGLLERKEQRSDISMEKSIYQNSESTILYGVPQVGWGCYNGSTPFPMCLTACAEYLGEDVEYSFAMAASAAAFRLTWNREYWDLSNLDIFHTFGESNDVYRLGAEALGREFAILGREEHTTKEEFFAFIKQHIDEGYPCIALGIIGPPEACIITGYRENGRELLGWNFFQNDPEFAASVKQDESGYFITDAWWENTDTQAVMCMGAIVGEKLPVKQLLSNAVKALEGREDGAYSKGILAYDAWKQALLDEKNFNVGDNYAVLFEKLLCQNDAMGCLADGRGKAMSYFRKLAADMPEADTSIRSCCKEIAEAFEEVLKAATKMQELYGDWSDAERMLEHLADRETRQKNAELIEQAKAADAKALEWMKKLTDELE